MRISTTTGGLSETNKTFDNKIRLYAAAGFDCVDLHLSHMWKADLSDIFLSENWQQETERLKQVAAFNNVSINQAHAPYSTSGFIDYLKDKERKKDILFRIKRAIAVAGSLGAQNIIVHPIHCFPYRQSDKREILKINEEFYGNLAETAKKYNINIAVENMWQREEDKIVPSVCANPEEMALYVDSFNKISPCFSACLDIGHAKLTGFDPIESIKILGNRLKALHVHDNNGINDDHTLPLVNSRIMYDVMASLKAINYNGDFTLESYAFLNKFRPEFQQEAAIFMAKTSRHLTEYYDNL